MSRPLAGGEGRPPELSQNRARVTARAVAQTDFSFGAGAGDHRLRSRSSFLGGAEASHECGRSSSASAQRRARVAAQWRCTVPVRAPRRGIGGVLSGSTRVRDRLPSRAAAVLRRGDSNCFASRYIAPFDGRSRPNMFVSFSQSPPAPGVYRNGQVLFISGEPRASPGVLRGRQSQRGQHPGTWGVKRVRHTRPRRPTRSRRALGQFRVASRHQHQAEVRPLAPGATGDRRPMAVAGF